MTPSSALIRELSEHIFSVSEKLPDAIYKRTLDICGELHSYSIKPSTPNIPDITDDMSEANPFTLVQTYDFLPCTTVRNILAEMVQKDRIITNLTEQLQKEKESHLITQNNFGIISEEYFFE